MDDLELRPPPTASADDEMPLAPPTASADDEMSLAPPDASADDETPLAPSESPDAMPAEAEAPETAPEAPAEAEATDEIPAEVAEAELAAAELAAAETPADVLETVPETSGGAASLDEPTVEASGEADSLYELPAEAPGSPDGAAAPPAEAPIAEFAAAGAAAGDTAVGDEPVPAPAGKVTVGRMVADALRRAGVRWAFTVPGESFLGLIDGLEAAGIHVVATRHEGAAAFMAEAHAQLTGRPAACLATRAVGAANLAIGIHTATADSSPMFALVGQVPRDARGREAFQEANLVETIGGLAKWAAEPVDVPGALAAVETAILEATTGRPGPVLLALAEDLLDELVPAGVPSAPPRAAARRPSDAEIGAILHLLADAERPVILAGGGILRARTSNDLLRLAELLRVPVIASWRRGDVITNDHPLYLGMAGFGSPPVVRERLATADAMLVLGCRLGEITSFGWTIPGDGTRWAHVDLAPGRPSAELRPPDLTLEADAKLFLRAAVSRLETRAVLEARSTDARVARNAADRAAWEAATVVNAHPWTGPGVHPGRVIATLRALLPDDGIVTTDAGSFGTWAARGFRFRRPGTFLGSTSGAMGYGLPAAIAAGLVHRDRSVVALVGDGGLGMTLAELETAVRMGLRTVVLVFDNEQYGMIRTYQERREGGSTAGTDLGPLDFAAAARAMGARGVRVESDAGVETALRQALVADRPTVIQLTVDRRWTGVDATP